MYATNGYVGAAVFTPAASSHVTPDSVGGAVEIVFLNRDGAPPPVGSQLRLLWSSLKISGGTVETTAWALHMYDVTPPSAFADDATFDVPAGDGASYLGSIAIAQVVDMGGVLFIEGTQSKCVKLAGTSAFAYLVNGTTLTPQAVAHTVTLHAEAI
jgi:hypothetical protein